MVRLTFVVNDIQNLWTLGYRNILIYRSTDENGLYSYFNFVHLKPNVKKYYFTDTTGDIYTWYKIRYSNTVPPPDPTLISSYSDAFNGEEITLYHNITYPSEVQLSDSDLSLVNKIRTLIGDSKELDRDYVHECYANVEPDGYTYKLENIGWPVYISLDGIEKTDLSDPIVNGYRYLTFSGMINTVTGTLDIYYYTFRWSDREIIENYYNCIIPPGLTSSTVTTDHLILQTAINLLESENWRDYIENGARVDDDSTRYDPTPGFNARERAIKRLRKQLDDLINQFKLAGIDGVRIE